MSTTTIDVIGVLKEELSMALDSYTQFIEHLENEVVLPESIVGNSVFIEIEKYASYIQFLSDEMRKYIPFDEALEECVAATEEFVEEIADRFLRFMYRKTMTTREAMDHFGKSRSTIYRWIRCGKLNAIKQGRHWVVAV